MTRKVATLFEGETLEQAIEGLRMVRFRHVPVVGPDGYLIGLVSQRDLLRALPRPLDACSDAKKDELLKKHRVGDIMTREVQTVSADTPLDEAGQIMIDEKRDCLPVKDEQGNLIGLVTATDYVRLAVSFLRDARR
jgi:CBS-domain-containing membrane protein